MVGCRLPYLVSKAITILFRLFRLVLLSNNSICVIITFFYLMIDDVDDY